MRLPTLRPDGRSRMNSRGLVCYLSDRRPLIGLSIGLPSTDGLLTATLSENHHKLSAPCFYVGMTLFHGVFES